MGSVLLIDDDPGIRYSFRRTFGDEFEVVSEASGEDGLRVLEEQSEGVDLVLLDIRMPGMDGFQVLEEVRGRHPNLPVVMVTAYSDTETAIQAMKQGAYDYLVKPFQVERVRELVEAARKQRSLTRASVHIGEESGDETQASDRMVGRSPAMLEVYKKIGQVAATELPCLITGETGTGKELVARAVVQHGDRAQQPFLVVDCAAVPGDLLEAELFGYEEGAFTGARRGGKVGKFELSTGGTLFLDEIGELPTELQAKLLRVLQTSRIQRVGGVDEIPVDVRIIAATCADLEAGVSAGRFRDDLYYRVNVFRIHLPPLRERGEDITDLVAYFVRKHGPAMGRPVRRVSETLIEDFQANPWPGNVRELENAVRRALVGSQGEVLSTEPTSSPPPGPEGPDELAGCAARALDELANTVDSPYHAFLARAEAALIAEALARTAGNISAASRMLGITRLTLRKKTEEYGITVDAESGEQAK